MDVTKIVNRNAVDSMNRPAGLATAGAAALVCFFMISLGSCGLGVV